MYASKQYILSIIICVFTCGVISQIIADTKRKKMMQLVSGLVLTISILNPLTKMDLRDCLKISEDVLSASDFYVSAGKRMASEATEEYIKDCCETYILDKAKTLDTEISVQISLNAFMIPEFAQITSEAAAKNVQTQLQELLMTDLGIPKENQEWTWNPESNSSYLS